MDEHTMRYLLQELIDEAGNDLRSALFGEFHGSETVSFRLAGLEGRGEGLVVKMPTGERFAVSVTPLA